MNLGEKQHVLYDLGWRLQHHLAVQGEDPDRVARAIGVPPDDLALALTGHHELSFSTLCAILDHLDLEWSDLYGTDLLHPPRNHHLTATSDVWHAMDGDLQKFDIRRDVERYRAGDLLWLWEKRNDNARGRVLVMRITYILYCASVGLPPGYVVLALERACIGRGVGGQ